jgi:adenosylcobinamide-phosphate synthase
MTGPAHAVGVLLAALAFDLLLGEPPTPLHPVVWMGRLQRRLRRLAPRSPAAAFVYGLGMAAVGPALFGLGAWLALRELDVWPVAKFLVEVYLLKSAFAVRALAGAGLTVHRELASGQLAGAREGLRSLVSRDTSSLSSSLMSAAAVESLSENSSDSIVAPLFYFLIAGVPGALAYRAANTLDALIGYHGETEWLGKAAARLDDVLNLVPARITAALLVVSCAACRASAAGALRSWWRDARLTESPNAGRPMAAVAGGLGVQLEKVGHYRLYAEGRLAEPADIRVAVQLLAVTTALAFSLALLALGTGGWTRVALP